MSEPVNALFATDSTTVTHAPGGGGAGGQFSGHWDVGRVEHEAGDAYRSTRHRTVSTHFSFAASAGEVSEGDTITHLELNHPVLDVLTDGVITILSLGQGSSAVIYLSNANTGNILKNANSGTPLVNANN